MYHSFLIHSSADGHVDCFHVLPIINSATMNKGEHVSLSILVSLVCMPRSGMLPSFLTWLSPLVLKPISDKYISEAFNDNKSVETSKEQHFIS